MKGKKSTGHDGINSILFRNKIICVRSPQKAMLNKSLETGEVANNLKLATVVPISGLGRLQDQGNRLRLLDNYMITITFILNVIDYIVK